MVLPKNPASCFTLLSAPIGILSFEAAASMSRLLSLHHSLSQPQLRRLRSDTMRSPGLSSLTSADQHLLLRLACAELHSQLDAAAASVSRFSSRCNSLSLLSFPRTYADLKSGRATAHFPTLSIQRGFKKMEKCVAVVANLLDEMETGEKNTPLLHSQRKKLGKLKEQSLWCKSFDDVVAMMSQAVLAIFARICDVFRPFVAGLPPVVISGGRISFALFNSKLRVYPLFAGRHYASGPIDQTKASANEIAIRNSCPIIGRGSKETEHKLPQDCRKILQPDERTVGGAGLALQYANIILSVETLMRIRSGVDCAKEGEEAAIRDEIYRMLPAKLKGMVRGRLRDRWRERGEADCELAEGWREAVERIMKWLVPLARETEKWQEERRMDKRQRLNTKPRVLALQTLMFADREKVGMVIVEVLVGFSCVCWYDGGDVSRTR